MLELREPQFARPTYASFKPEKFTVNQTCGLAQSRISFPTENEPIFQYRRQGLELERAAHFAKGKTKANSQHAIQKRGGNTGSGNAEHQGSPAGISFLRSPDPVQRIKERSQFHTLRPLRQIARRRSPKSSEKPIYNTLVSAAGARAEPPCGPMASVLREQAPEPKAD